MTPESIKTGIDIEKIARVDLENLKREIETNYPKTESGIRDLALKFSLDDEFRKKLMANPELVKDHLVKEKYNSIFQELQDAEERRANVIKDPVKGKNEAEVTRRLTDQATNLKRMLNMIGDAATQQRMRRTDAHVGSQPEGMILSDKSVGAISFLEQLNKQKLSVMGLARLVPLVMRVLKNPAYFAITQKAALQNVTITENKGSNTDNIISPFGPDVIKEVRINLPEESFERDLVLLKMSDDALFDAVWNSYAQCVSGLSQDDQATIGSPNAELSELKSSIVRAAQKLKGYASGIVKADKPSETSTLTGAKAADNDRKIKELAEQLKPFTTDEIFELETLAEGGALSPDQAQRLEQLKAYRDSVIERDNIKTEQLRNDVKNLQMTIEALKKIKDPTPEQKKMLIDAQRDLEELPQNALYDSQIKASLSEDQRRMLKAIAITTEKRMKEIAATSPPKDRPNEERIARWAGTFILSIANTGSYLKDFYKPFFDEIKEEIRNAAKVEYDHHTLDSLTATRVEKEIQNIIASIITSTLSPAMEAGGEPVGKLEQALQATNSNAKQRLGLIMRALTRIKLDSAKMTNLPEGLDHVEFVNAFRDTQDVWDPKERRTIRVQTGRVQHEHGGGGMYFHKHARDLEEFFEVFHGEIAGNYDVRAAINDGDGKFYERVKDHHGDLNHYSLSKQFDIIHNSDIGPDVAAALPLCRVLMMRYFAEKGWVADEEINRDLSEPKGYLNSIVSKFMKENYPHYSDNKRNMITYIAVKQAYLHSVYQLMLSNARFLSGFSGGKHKENNAYFNEDVAAEKYAGSLSQFDYKEFGNHKTFARGALFLPGALGGFDAIEDIDPSNINNYFDSGYGSIMHELSGKYGQFLRYFNPMFEKHLPDSLLPRNRYRNGSDDNLRGWRQLKKSKDNVSRKLYTYGDRKDWVILSAENKEESHYTDIWKSVENLGTNYLRTWMDGLVAGEYNEAKVRHLMAFLYRRYFDGATLGVDFGKKVLANLEVTSASSDADFAQKVIVRIAEKAKEKGEEQKKSGEKVDEKKEKKNRKDAADEVMRSIFYGANMVLMAERTPTVLMDATTPWSEQTGVTLIAQIKSNMIANPSTYAEFVSGDNGKIQLNSDVWQQTADDLALVQTEARRATTSQIMRNRETWENETKTKGYESNTFGKSFNQDRSSVELVAGESGYAITDAYIAQVLTEKFKNKKESSPGEGDLSPEEIQKRINRALLVRKEILQQMVVAPEAPKYSEVKAEMESLLSKALSKGPTLQESDIVAFKSKIMGNIGANEAEYLAKYQQKLKSRASFFMDQWSKSDMVFEPESDAAENFMHYENADANHIGRMAGITEVTTVKTKHDLNYSEETSMNEIIKNFAKDPYAAIDAMSAYLNKYRHQIEDERGADYSQWYVGWYVNKVLQANLKEERYRTGFTGMYHDVQKILFGQSKTSFAGDKNQPYTSKSISALEGNRIIRYLIQKKLIGPQQGDAYMRRYRSTLGDIFKELAPRIGIVALVAFGVHLTKSSVEKDTDLK